MPTSLVLAVIFLFVQRQAAVLTGVHIHQLCAGGFGHALPGHQVGVMLSHRDDDFIALMQKVHAVAVGHQVQRLGGVLGEDDLVILGVKELGYRCGGLPSWASVARMASSYTPRWGLALSLL